MVCCARRRPAEAVLDFVGISQRKAKRARAVGTGHGEGIIINIYISLSRVNDGTMWSLSLRRIYIYIFRPLLLRLRFFFDRLDDLSQSISWLRATPQSQRERERVAYFLDLL